MLLWFWIRACWRQNAHTALMLTSDTRILLINCTCMNLLRTKNTDFTVHFREEHARGRDKTRNIKHPKLPWISCTSDHGRSENFFNATHEPELCWTCTQQQSISPTNTNTKCLQQRRNWRTCGNSLPATNFQYSGNDFHDRFHDESSAEALYVNSQINIYLLQATSKCLFMLDLLHVLSMPFPLLVLGVALFWVGDWHNFQAFTTAKSACVYGFTWSAVGKVVPCSPPPSPWSILDWLLVLAVFVEQFDEGTHIWRHNHVRISGWTDHEAPQRFWLVQIKSVRCCRHQQP